MKGDVLSEIHHVARYCSGTKLSENGNPAPTAFHLRPGESYLSVQWLEYFNQQDRVGEVRKAVKALDRYMQLGATAKLAVMNVGQVCQHVATEAEYTIRILHDPTEGNEAHAGIHDTIQDEMIIAELLAESVAEMHSVK